MQVVAAGGTGFNNADLVSHLIDTGLTAARLPSGSSWTASQSGEIQEPDQSRFNVMNSQLSVWPGSNDHHAFGAPCSFVLTEGMATLTLGVAL